MVDGPGVGPHDGDIFGLARMGIIGCAWMGVGGVGAGGEFDRFGVVRDVMLCSGIVGVAGVIGLNNVMV